MNVQIVTFPPIRKLVTQAGTAAREADALNTSGVSASISGAGAGVGVGMIVPAEAFTPTICALSHKLASKKERRERERMQQVLRNASKHNNTKVREGGDDAVPTTVTAAVEDEVSTAAVHDISQRAFDTSLIDLDGDDSPPPPPPPPAFEESAVAAPLSHHDIMYARGLLRHQKQLQVAKELVAQELKECTFRPKIIPPLPLPPPLMKNKSTTANTGGGAVDESTVPTQHRAAHRRNPAAQTEGGGDGESPAPQQGTGGVGSIHHRLYNLKDKVRSHKLSEPSQRMVEEMQACTFAPQMRSSFYHRGELPQDAQQRQHHHSQSHSHLHQQQGSPSSLPSTVALETLEGDGGGGGGGAGGPPSNNSTNNALAPTPLDGYSVASSSQQQHQQGPILGYTKTVQRMRRANDEKQRRALEESHERQQELLNQSYQRSRELARQGTVPFKFRLQQRNEAPGEDTAKRRGNPK